jgi:hypothetical protein
MGPALNSGQIWNGFMPGKNITRQVFYKAFAVSSCHFLSCEEKCFRSCACLMHLTQSGSENKFHFLHFLIDFRRCSLSEIVRDNSLPTRHKMSL